MGSGHRIYKNLGHPRLRSRTRGDEYCLLDISDLVTGQTGGKDSFVLGDRATRRELGPDRRLFTED